MEENKNKETEKKKRDGLIEYIRILFYCIGLSWRASHIYTLLRILCEICPSLLGIIGSFLGKYLLDLLAGSGTTSAPSGLFVVLVGAVSAVRLLQNSLQKAAQYIQAMHEELLQEELSLRLIDCATKVDLEYFDDTEYYDKLQAAGRDAFAITQALWNAISFLGASLTFLMAFFILWQEHPFYALPLLFAAVPYGITSTKYTKSLYQLSMEQLNMERRKAYFRGISMEKRYAQDVRLFGMGELLKEKYQNLWEEVFQRRRAVVRGKTIVAVLLSCLPELVLAWISLDIGFRVFGGKASVGDYPLYTGMTGQLLSAFFVMSYSFTNIYDNRLRIVNLKQVLGFHGKLHKEGIQELKQVDTISFEHVSFSYPGTKGRRVLEDVSFLLEKEKRTVFIGVNGSGKSTLVKLLLRMYEPDEGIIRINGVDIREYTIKSLRKNFSVYFQEMGNYCMTLSQNIRVSDLEKETQGEQEALEKACCQDILEKASKGLDTNLMRIFDQEGIELSGGQHQKLALARCLYRRHTVLILDEPSSNLDPKAEHDIFENLKKESKDKMTIFTSHRLSNVVLADRILVLENGTILEDGTQKELLANNKRYAELYHYQSEKFQAVLGEEG